MVSFGERNSLLAPWLVKGQGKVRMKGQGKARMKGQGEVRMKGQGKVRRAEACLGMPGHVGTCPGREPQTSPGGGPTTKLSNQEPTRSPWTPITAEPAFSSLYGSPTRAIKSLPHPSYLADSFPPPADSYCPADSLYPADSLCFADPPSSLPCLPAPRSSA